MSQDPPSGYNPNPEKSYTDPSSYEIPSQTPDGRQPSQNPYQDPPQTYYGEYQQPPYGMPPQGAYGIPGYGPNQDGYVYEASAPLPLGEAVSQLPNQYVRVLTRPSAFTFAAEMGKASWDILWVQLIGYAVISAILAYMYTLLPWASSPYNTQDGLPASFYQILHFVVFLSSIGLVIVIPISFFIWQGIIYLLAKAFNGTGTFLMQGYNYLLITVPIGIVGSVLAFIPILGSLVSLGLGIYGIVLQIYSLMAVHRLSGGKATAVFFISAFILFVVFFVSLVFIIILALAMSPTMQ